MTDKQFAELVYRMRQAQREFFKAQPGSPERKSALVLSKKLELAVDEVLEMKRHGLFSD